MASVTPVVDGFVLRKGESAHVRARHFVTVSSIHAGLAYSSLPKLVLAHARHIIGGKRIDLMPHQLIGNKLV
jgi:hypothetical protein